MALNPGIHPVYDSMEHLFFPEKRLQPMVISWRRILAAATIQLHRATVTTFQYQRAQSLHEINYFSPVFRDPHDSYPTPNSHVHQNARIRQGPNTFSSSANSITFATSRGRTPTRARDTIGGSRGKCQSRESHRPNSFFLCDAILRVPAPVPRMQHTVRNKKFKNDGGILVVSLT